MTPDQLFRDPQLDCIILHLRQTERNVVHKINVVFNGPEIRAQNAVQLAELIKLRVEKAKQELAAVVQKSIP